MQSCGASERYNSSDVRRLAKSHLILEIPLLGLKVAENTLPVALGKQQRC